MIAVYCMIPVVLQGIAMMIDEGWCHRDRGLTRWERIRHPLDTLSVVVCLGWLLAVKPGSPAAVPVYIALAAFSTVFVARNHGGHAELNRLEHRVHAVLFVLHPIALTAFGLLWWAGDVALVYGQFSITVAFVAYQVLYWQFEQSDDAPEVGATVRNLCDGSRDAEAVLADEVRARPVRDLGFGTR